MQTFDEVPARETADSRDEHLPMGHFAGLVLAFQNHLLFAYPVGWAESASPTSAGVDDWHDEVGLADSAHPTGYELAARAPHAACRFCPQGKNRERSPRNSSTAWA